MNLLAFDKRCALERIKQLDVKPFLTSDEQRDYQNRVEIVEEYDRQFRKNWKSDRRDWIKAQLRKGYLTIEQSEEKFSQLDSDADLILGKPKYPWGSA
ncbi:TPA: hypothetical protein ACVO3D_003835 [Vibrio diabolicus]|uniref:hypothetical protein n=1 Tax=Vibrio TaxID=662 RepID=UPI0021D37A38|nr:MULTISPECIES: hypothetical protein [unclassified Vibrio]EJN3357955.1 hypothetical protein [Vibrio alginolyticus]MBE3725424.1 hypothetical protein [Vibrio parahaemolyticus]ELB1089328.1 hypothetical protein [Vibrio alginolyticus]ELB1661636.1 hypothetical protein [Vibrio alginolyticus]MDK9742056.1 hypothetical protein [Vibrio sp. B516a]